MQDKSLLLRPLSDTHLIEVYHEAKAMRLSEEFISLIEQAIEQRGLSDDHVHQQRGALTQ
ncbi:sporulation histidine kinase inhibitor Sda [Paenibacillus sp. sptzw28]|nr:sporulation histidine kinase inhibitor Sda [Paenibacillus sp. sptzw28]